MAAMCIKHMEHKPATRVQHQDLLQFAGRTFRVWAGVKQPVTGHLVPIRQLRSTHGDLRNNAQQQICVWRDRCLKRINT
jgi:hypothetical protein